MSLIGQEFFIQEEVSRVQRLKLRIREAIAWGVPDNESTGMSPEAFTRLLSEALKEIENLERKLDEIK